MECITSQLTRLIYKKNYLLFKNKNNPSTYNIHLFKWISQKYLHLMKL